MKHKPYTEGCKRGIKYEIKLCDEIIKEHYEEEVIYQFAELKKNWLKIMYELADIICWIPDLLYNLIRRLLDENT